jgi:cytochrome c biogenesis protein CcmG, thiol:disulfide interchange protein DsbE
MKTTTRMLLAACTTALIVATAGCGFHLHPSATVGKPLPDLSFATLDGSTEQLQPAHGRITFVNVFATWCPPCKAETPDLVAFASAWKDRGVDVVGIDQEETAPLVEAFASRYHIAYPMLIDSSRQTKDLLGARVIPHTIVVDGTGTVRAIVNGPMTRAQMDELAAKAGAGS